MENSDLGTDWSWNWQAYQDEAAQSTTPPPPPPPPPNLLDPFLADLAKYNPLFFQTGEEIRGLAGAFAPDKIMQLQRAKQLAELQGISQTFGRLGTGNTTAELNAINRARGGFANQDIQALMSGAQAQSGLLTQSLDPFNQGLQNQTVQEQLRIMALAAQNAGKDGGGEDNGGGGLLDDLFTNLGL